MDEKDKAKEPNLDLDEILQEFSPEEPGEEDVRVWDGKPRTEPAVSGDTVPLNDISQALGRQEYADGDDTRTFRPVRGSMEETRAFRPVGASMEETRPFTPVGEEKASERIVLIPEKPGVEPYSENWEPEYEQPIGDYVVQEPIAFRPKPRKSDFKRKLVEGPERRFYALSELGLGKLRLAALGCILVAVMAVVTTVLHALGVIGEERTKFVIFCQFLSLLLSALLGSYQLLEGFADLLRLRFSVNSLLLFSLIVSVVDAVLCLTELRVPCSAAFSICTVMSLRSAYQKRDTEMSQMDTLRKAGRLDGIFSVPDYHDGKPGFLRGEGDVDDFMDNYRRRSGPEKVLSGYAFAAFLAGIGIGIAAGVMHGFSFGVQAASAALLAAMPASIFVTLSRPGHLLQRRLHRLGAVYCGWDGVRELSRTAVFPLDHTDLFPGGAIKLNGVKYYSRTPDEVIASVAALMDVCGGTMAPLFLQLREERGLARYTPEELRFYAGGIGGVIEGEAVLAGSLQFMRTMGVEMPEGTRVSQAVYVAIDGELAGVFALTIGKVRATAGGMNTLCAYRRLRPVLTTPDFLLTEGFLRSRFKCNTRRIDFPAMEIRRELAAKRPAEDSPASALITREGLAPAAYAVTGARALHSAANAGTTVHLLGGILGIGIIAVLAVLNAAYLLTPINVLLYGLVWMIPGMLITEWTRSI